LELPANLPNSSGVQNDQGALVLMGKLFMAIPDMVDRVHHQSTNLDFGLICEVHPIPLVLAALLPRRSSRQNMVLVQ